MGKSLIITDADFSANGFRLESNTPAWTSRSFIYADDDKIYKDEDCDFRAFYLESGQTISYCLNIGESTYYNQYAKIQVGIIDGHVPNPGDITDIGTIIGTVTSIITTPGFTRFQAVAPSSYTAEEDVTFFITGNVGDVIFVMDD